MQSYILDGTRHRTVRDPHTGVCCLYRGPAAQPPEADELVKEWATTPDGSTPGPEGPVQALTPARKPTEAKRMATPVAPTSGTLF